MNTSKLNNEFSNSYLAWDSLTSGGLSIVFCLLMWAFFDRSASVLTVSQLAFALAFVMNHPHFLSSYVLLYGDFKKNIFSNVRYFFSAIVVPIVLLVTLYIAFVAPEVQMMSHIITAMFFLVGWHYVKQTFGFIIVSSAQRKFYYSDVERRIMLLNLFLLWMMSVLGSHTRTNEFTFYGIQHYSLALPVWTLKASYLFVAISFLWVIGMHIKKYIADGAIPSAPAVCAYLAIYCWYVPFAAHPAFGYFIPFFHSLQYLGYVWLFKKNQISNEVKGFQGRKERMEWVKKSFGFSGAALGLGALAFYFIPTLLDSMGLEVSPALGQTPFLVSFLLFINIHHYFIDNTIWRSTNPLVKRFLFEP